MAMKSRTRPDSEQKSVTADRAARLYRLVQFLGSGPKTREALRRKLKLDTRGFYRDLEFLRAAGITVDLDRQRYSGRLKEPRSQSSTWTGSATFSMTI